MAKNNDEISFNRAEVVKFLAEREKAIAASGARILMLTEKAEELGKRVKETDKKLRLML